MDLEEKLKEMSSTNVDTQKVVDVEEKKEIKEEQMEEEKPQMPTIKDIGTYDEAIKLAKISNLSATATDENFVGELSEQNKNVLSASIELERQKVEKEKMELELEQTKIQSKKESDLNARLKEKFGSKLDAQEYHYKSLKPILETVGIKSPMNVWVMWIVAIFFCIIPVYPIKLVICATIGNLIAGASSESRKGLAKGIFWTSIILLILAMASLAVIGLTKLIMAIF